MTNRLRSFSPERYLLFCIVLGAVVAAAATLIPGIDFGFFELFLLFTAFDVAVYLAMKAGWIRTPRQRREN